MDLLTPHPGLFFWTLVAFLIVLFILGKYAWHPIINALNDREKKIADSIASAEKMKNEMKALKADNEKLLQEARQERSRLLQEAKESKEKIIDEAKHQAQKEANIILTNAHKQIENEKNAALNEVKNEVGNLAVAVAEKILRKELAQAENQEEYIKSLTEDITLN